MNKQMAKKYRVTFTAMFECTVEAEDKDDAASNAHIPEGEGTAYLVNTFEVSEIEEVEE